MELSGKLITLAGAVSLGLGVFYSFRWRALSRTTWAFFWGFLGLSFLNSLLMPREHPMEFWLLLTLAFMGVTLWGVVILPVLLVGGTLMRRVRRGRARSDTDQ